MAPSLNGKRYATELKDYSFRRRETTGPYADDLDIDALIVGAGFSGIFMLKTLRDQGFRVVVYEAGTSIGGTWHWNNYPGARTDSQVIEYEFSWPEVWKDWTWTTNYPDIGELRAYFDHVDKVVNVRKDCSFGTVVTGSEFDVEEGKWHVETADGRTAKCKYLVIAAGFSSKRYFPDWPGVESFKGIIQHSSFWQDQITVSDKRCAVIGTGASGVQIAQEWAPDARSLTVFQRSPNTAIPMRRRDLAPEEQNASAKAMYPYLFKLRETTIGGMLYGPTEHGTFDDNPEERKRFFQSLWEAGGLKFWLGGYKDLFCSAEASKEAYAFWVQKVRPRVKDPRKRDILAPLEAPYYFGMKRPSLENNFYEQFNRENVDVVDVSNNQIIEFTETGLVLQDGTHHELDVVAVATGFDITTGGLTNMGIRSINGTALEDEWKKAANTYLGMTIHGYPNMFHIYGAHGPTSVANGPTAMEVQGRWIGACIRKIERDLDIKYINPTLEATRKWKAHINELSKERLFATTRSTYMGGSVPGKAFEQVNYVGGVPEYKKEIWAALDSWEGFELVGR
ncbi:HK97 family phage prohead protease [Colletotrichum truncatum]|uniref:HK97 family phage prohead protease n=1 Tax=Colletotrichum truncatum TaxID=5467 RepID=A0ACC3Z3N5_COLTU|nr:HK97 family phage prohead protease [Colletotrichum truncatum]KAF6795535.1 HK97 family phage prohead protease [Colletotrichum truncatum]